MKFLVIGGNAAGMSFAAKYKRNNPEAEITVLEARDYVSFGACGLPYYVADFFTNKEEMIARTVEQTHENGIDLKINTKVTKVDRQNKEVIAYCNNEEIVYQYDKLFVSTGANPIIPNFGTYKADNVHTLVNMQDGIEVRKRILDENIKNVCIIGGGFIGIEVLDVAVEHKKNVCVIEREETIMSNQFSPEMIEPVEAKIRKKAQLLTKTTVQEIVDAEHGYIVKTDSGDVEADLIILALGFRPNTDFIEIEKIRNGALVIDKYGQTADPDIYAAGDCALIYNQVLDEMVYLPLATSANKQGRMMADFLSNKEVYFDGMLGSACLKILDFEMACTGINEKQAISKNIKYKSVVVNEYTHSNYYPGREKLAIKLVYDPDDFTLLGGEIIGRSGAVARIDTLAVAISAKMTTKQLGYIDLCYAPPFSRTWSALNVAGNVAK